MEVYLVTKVDRLKAGHNIANLEDDKKMLHVLPKFYIKITVFFNLI